MISFNFLTLKGGGTPDFELNFKRFKEGIEERKLFLKTPTYS